MLCHNLFQSIAFTSPTSPRAKRPLSASALSCGAGLVRHRQWVDDYVTETDRQTGSGMAINLVCMLVLSLYRNNAALTKALI